ncbi:alanine--tRNA ligase-like isoform X2 [Rosa rugosa]|uniref:alanine--tRNA ligase-like isoform X2 n=1 Tax=Rosa rugosa TaxID=74645 RepID=UPI002B40F14D|nr:alanine--tRNA ligase-like isoform X2 [Rosa rugosa]
MFEFLYGVITSQIVYLLGNDGHEYVLRCILRRAVRYGREVVKAQEGFFNGLVPVLAALMGDVFPELKQHEAGIREIIKEEEEAFGKTLIKGIEKFKKAAQDVQGKTFSGQVMDSSSLHLRFISSVLHGGFYLV